MKKLFFVTLFLSTTFFYAQNWQSHFDTAKTLAKNENKNIILVFSGSDWCAPCIKLDTNIWKSAEFKNESAKNWIIYKADFPKKKANQLSEQLTKENGQLAEKYNNSGIFPLVLVLNPDGKVLGTMGYENITPQQYINKLIALGKK